MRRALILFTLLFLPVVLRAQGPATFSNPLGGNLTVQDAGTCSTTGSFLWQHLPSNASTTTVNLAGTFSGTLTIRLSNNGGGSWTTNNTTTSAGTTSVSTNGFTDICADVTTFTSGSFGVTITTGLNTGPQGPAGPAGSGGGITSVAVLPGTCTPQQLFQLLDGSLVPCGPAANQFGTPTGRTIDPRDYGAKENTKFYFGGSSTIAVNNTSPNVSITGANFCNGGSVPCAAGQLSTVGQFVNITNWCCNTSVSQSTASIALIPANTTVLSVTDSSHIVLSANATGSCTTSCAVAIFSDDTAAIDFINNTVIPAQLGCAVIHFVGFSATKHSVFNTHNAICEKNGVFTDVAGGNWVTGDGINNSGIYIENEFDHAQCTGTVGGFTNICFLAGVSGGRDFAFFGLGLSNAGRTDSARLVVPYQGTSTPSQAFTNVGFLDFDGGNPGGGIGTNVGVILSSGTFVNLWNVGFGASACSFGGQGGPNYTQVFGGGCSNTLNSNLNINGPTTTTGFTLGQVATTQPTVTVNNVAAVWYSHGDAIYNNPVANSLINISNGTAYIDGLTANNSLVAGYNAIAIGSSGIVHLSHSTLSSGVVGNGAGVNLFQSGAKLFDECGNSYGTASTITGGIISGPCIMQGSCSGVGTAASTLGLYGLGQFSALTCTSTTVNLGQVMQQAGTLMGVQVTATAAGTNASSGVVTVLKNGGATTITCTIGTGTSCFDMNHATAYVQGDVISAQFTTQAADTLAGIKAVILKQ